MNSVFRINNVRIAPPEYHEGFAELRLEWNDLSLSRKQKLLKEILGHGLEYDEQWYYISLIIPITDNMPDLNNSYIFLYDYAPDPECYQEIGDMTASGELEYLKPITLTPADKVSVLATFVPSNT